MSSAIAQPESEAGFDRFALHTTLNHALRDAGFRAPRAIQSETIPAALRGRDVLGLAQTGTGKTAAFAIPLLQRLLDGPARKTRALILAPTRELARQIETETRALARHTKLSTTSVFGGVPLGRQIRELRRRPAIVVGCPGRVLDLLQQGALDLRGVEMLVLDEADHMLDMGFLPDVKKILAQLPGRRQNLMFSATMPSAIRGLADELLRDPHVVELAPSAPAAQIEHFLLPVREDAKRAALDHVLAKDDCQTAIVFMRTKHRAKRTAQQLERQGRRAVALQGNMSQAQRDRAMAGFRKGRFDVLVATDIAARGLDVAGVDYVVNFDVPNTPEAYTHRIGRTGRSEATGKACTFVTTEDRGWLRDTERILGAEIPVREAEGLSGTLDAEAVRRPGRGAKRPGRNAQQPGRGSKRSGAARAGRRPRRGRRSNRR